MSDTPVIHIPNHDEPLALEPCEVEWAANSFGWVSSRQLAAVYQCALRDAVLVHFQKDGGWTIQLTHYERFNHFENTPDLKSVLRVDVQSCGIDKGITGEHPTELHVWRELAKLLKLGPWAS